MKNLIPPSSVLIIVDVQKDFCSGGALEVPEGDRIIPVFNRYIRIFTEKDYTIIATRDWHPSDHCSFKTQGGPWPEHCVQNTPGAEFHPDLQLPQNTIVISSATHKEREAYSGFSGTNLEKILRNKNIQTLFIGDLATDYCVKHTVLDALKAGFDVFLLTDAIRGVNVNPGDSERAIEKMIAAGAQKMTLGNLS